MIIYHQIQIDIIKTKNNPELKEDTNHHYPVEKITIVWHIRKYFKHLLQGAILKSKHCNAFSIRMFPIDDKLGATWPTNSNPLPTDKHSHKARTLHSSTPCKIIKIRANPSPTGWYCTLALGLFI